MTIVHNFRETPVFDIEDSNELEKLLKSKSFKNQFGDFTSPPPSPTITLAEQFLKILENSDLTVRRNLFEKFGKQSLSIETDHILTEIFFDSSLYSQIRDHDFGIVIQNIAAKGMLEYLIKYFAESKFAPPQVEMDEFFNKINYVIEFCRDP
jgi:hypothetical protein